MGLFRRTINGVEVAVIVTPAVRPMEGQQDLVAGGYLAAIRTDGAPNPLFGEFLKGRVFQSEAEARDAAFDEVTKRLTEDGPLRTCNAARTLTEAEQPAAMRSKPEDEADTSDFELLDSLRPEEQEALAHYKDFSDYLNCGLRGGTLDEKLTMYRHALDSAVRKGRTARPLTLYRATCAHYVPVAAGTEYQDLAFVSTSLCPEGLVAFYCADAPAKLVIDNPAGSPLACFPCDSGGGGENERLLPRGTKFRVLASRAIEDRSAILREQCTTSDRGELYLQRGAKLRILHVGVVW
jgi:hypothetical protein